MLFNSLDFLIFFPIVTALYFLLPQRWRWAMLLAASCVFYMAFIPAYILILALTIVVDYFAGILISSAVGPRRKAYLAASIVANVGVLAVFKYYKFIAQNIEAACYALGLSIDVPPLERWYDAAARAIESALAVVGIEWQSPVVTLLLPIGLSFHTFQAMSYTIEVYRGRQRAERHFGIYALYVMFYPQLVAGPIERPQNLLHQFRERHVFDFERVRDGLSLMLWGLFKKVVIADRLAAIVNIVYGAPENFHGVQVWVATYCFAFQIYCDFSGYSDIALGAARVMGFDLMQNFRRPYHATSIADFWRRWHISLSTWFRDYLYFPLGGNRGSTWQWRRNLLIVFLVSGLWHGADWKFVIWGGLHGLYLVVGLMSLPIRDALWQRIAPDSPLWSRVRAVLAMFVTFHLVLLAWVFFRANSLHDAMLILDHAFVADWLAYPLKEAVADLYDLVVAFGLIVLLETVHYLERDKPRPFICLPRPAWRRWTLNYAVVLLILLLGNFVNQEFIYFQF